MLTPAAVNSCLESVAGPDAVKEPELVLVSMQATLRCPSPHPCCKTHAGLHALPGDPCLPLEWRSTAGESLCRCLARC